MVSWRAESRTGGDEKQQDYLPCGDVSVADVVAVVLDCLGDFDSPRPAAPVDDAMMSIKIVRLLDAAAVRGVLRVLLLDQRATAMRSQVHKNP